MNRNEKNILSSIYEKVHNSERLLELLLANELIDLVDVSGISEKKKLSVETPVVLSKEVKGILKNNKIKAGKNECVMGKQYQYVMMETGVGIKNIIEIWNVFYEYQPNLIPVFQYQKINGNQKKALLRERISFCVLGKEIHLFGE